MIVLLVKYFPKMKLSCVGEEKGNSKFIFAKWKTRQFKMEILKVSGRRGRVVKAAAHAKIPSSNPAWGHLYGINSEQKELLTGYGLPRNCEKHLYNS